MRRKFYALLTIAVVFAAQSQLPGHARDMGGPLPDAVELNLQNADADEQLIQLAHAAKINVMADATDWPAAAKNAETNLSVERQQPLIGWLRDISYLNRLTWLRTENNNFVVWSEPDIVSLARRMAAATVAQRPQFVAAALPELRKTLDADLVTQLDADPQQWSALLARTNLYGVVLYDSLLDLAKKQGWDGVNQDFKAQIPDAQIPLTLRAQVALQNRLQHTQPKLMTPLAWLRDETWQQARLTVQQSTPSRIDGVLQPRVWGLDVTAPIAGKPTTQSVVALTDEGGVQ